MMNWLKSLVDKIFAVVGALALAQAPHFIEHYKQRLAGHLSELKWQIHQIENFASKSGKSLSEYINYFSGRSDPLIAEQGVMLDTMVARYTTFDHSYQSLLSASPFTRPFVFMKEMDISIARETYVDFSFGLSLTTETVFYSFIGLCIGSFLFWSLMQVFFLFGKSFSKNKIYPKNNPIV